MKVAFHSTPYEIKSKPPYSNSELFRLVGKAFSLGFKCFEVGPLWIFEEIDAKGLKDVLDLYGVERSVHVGGRYDAEKFAATKQEYNRVQQEVQCGIELCQELASRLVSIHPPFFMTNTSRDTELLAKARKRFLKLVKDMIEFASDKGIKMSLESYCYPPFIFNDLPDFMQFISCFPPAKLGVLLEAGHLFHAGFSLDEAVHAFGNRLSDVHVHDATLGGDVRKATHLPIGRGHIDFSHLISVLRAVRYDGWLTLEIHGSEREITESKSKLENIMKATSHTVANGLFV